MKGYLWSTNNGDVKVNIALINNYGAAGAPTVNDDSGDGYSIGSVWITAAGAIYTCVDATAGAAVWTQEEALVGATAQSQPADPTAPASTSAYAMQGLAGAITPKRSGKIMVTISGNIICSTTTAGDGIDVQISHGTGTAPANAAALAGTQDGNIQGYRNPSTVTAADVLVPFSTTAVIIGLTLDTAYWLDLAAKSIGTASACGLANLSVSAVEV